MRITNTMMTNNLINSINRNLTNVNDYYRQMSTGKKIAMPSDDPIIASRALKFRNIVSETEQYQKNVDQATSWMEITESAFKNVNSLMEKMDELCVQGASDSYSTDDRKKILIEFNSLVDQFESEMNATYMGRHIFSGYKTDQKAVLDDGTLNPEVYDDPKILDQNLDIEIGVNNYMNVNSLAPNIYPKEMHKDFHSFEEKLKQIEDAEKSDLTDEEKVALEEDLRKTFGEMVGKLENHSKVISEQHTSVGVRMSRLELTKNRLSDDNANYTTLLSNNEDVNLADSAMNYSMADSVYNASLKIGMNITKLTLADYL